MLNAQTALTAAQVPGYRGAFRSTADCPEPPDSYCVYLYTRTPVWDADDRPRGTRIRAFLHFFCRSDPTAAMDAIRTAMKQEGFSLIRETEGYVDEAEDYETVSEWEGVRDDQV